MIQEFKFNLGDKVRDIVTNCEGVVVNCSIWFNGCIRYAVQQPMGEDKKVPDPVWIDEAQMESVTVAPPRVLKHTGGPQKDPQRGIR